MLEKSRQTSIAYFHLVRNDEIFLHKIFLLVILYTANIWRTFDMNGNIVTQKFLQYILGTKLMQITVNTK